MKITLNSGIKSISGKSGGMMFRTFKKRDGSTETRMYLLPRKRNGEYGYTRKSRVSEKEQAARSQFALISEKIKNLSEEKWMIYRDEYVADKYKFNGKKYATLRGYIVARLYAEEKARLANIGGNMGETCD